MTARMEKVRKALGGDGTPYAAALAEVEEWETRRQELYDALREEIGNAEPSKYDLRRRAEAAEADLYAARLVVADREQAAQHAIHERARVEADRDEARQEGDSLAASLRRMYDRAEAAEAALEWKNVEQMRQLAEAEAEADRLKAALKAVVDYFDCLQPDECGGRIGTCRVCSARAALAPADRNTT